MIDKFETRNRNDRLLTPIVTDCSRSMRENNNIDHLNQGFFDLVEALKADELTATRVQLRNYSFGGQNEVVKDPQWTDAIDYTAPNLKADGWTPLGQAMEEARNDVLNQCDQLRSQGIGSWVPWMFFFCDGMPTDKWEETAKKCYEATEQGKVIIWPIGVGKYADIDILQKFSTFKAIHLDEAKWPELFEWIRVSLQAVSLSTSGSSISIQKPSPSMQISV